MKKFLAAGLISIPLLSSSSFVLAQSPKAAAVVSADRDVYRPADEGWSIKLGKGWEVKSASSNSPVDKESIFSRTASHQFESEQYQHLEVFVMTLKQKGALTQEQKSKLCDSFLSLAEKKSGRLSRTHCDPKVLGLTQSCHVEDWIVIGSKTQQMRVVVDDHVSYMLIMSGTPTVSDTTRAVIDTFRLNGNENPFQVKTTETTKPKPTVTDAAIRPARNAVLAPPSDTPNLPALFESLGYTAQNIGTDADPAYRLSFERDGWTFHLTCRPSKNKQELWLFSNVGGEGVDPSRLSPSGVLALLAENEKDRLAYFSFNNERKQFVLITAMNTRQLSAKVLQERIDLLTGVIKETAPLWGSLATPSERK